MALNGLPYKWLAIKRRVAGYGLKTRISRLWQHLSGYQKSMLLDKSVTRFRAQPLAFLVDLLFYVLDVFAIGEWYETLCDLAKFNTRALNQNERAIVQELFAGSIDADRIRIDDFAFAPRFMRIAYVGIYTINSYGKMHEDLFVHELIHIWQYEHLGSVYIPRALRAQRSDLGYNYGGVEALRDGPNHLLGYNYEQQGDILADYWRAKHRRPCKWKNLTKTTVPYQGLIEQLKPQQA